MARIIALSSRNNANNGTGGVTWPPGGSPVNISAPIKEPRRCFYATRPTTPCQNIRDIAQLLDDIRPTGKTCPPALLPSLLSFSPPARLWTTWKNRVLSRTWPLGEEEASTSATTFSPFGSFHDGRRVTEERRWKWDESPLPAREHESERERDDRSKVRNLN